MNLMRYVYNFSSMFRLGCYITVHRTPPILPRSLDIHIKQLDNSHYGQATFMVSGGFRCYVSSPYVTTSATYFWGLQRETRQHVRAGSVRRCILHLHHYMDIDRGCV